MSSSSYLTIRFLWQLGEECLDPMTIISPSPKSSILSMTPFFCDDQVIQVGGRVDASDFNFDITNPVLSNFTHHFTKILFEHQLSKKLHTAPQLLLAISRICVTYKW